MFWHWLRAFPCVILYMKNLPREDKAKSYPRRYIHEEISRLRINRIRFNYSNFGVLCICRRSFLKRRKRALSCLRWKHETVLRRTGSELRRNPLMECVLLRKLRLLWEKFWLPRREIMQTHKAARRRTYRGRNRTLRNTSWPCSRRRLLWAASGIWVQNPSRRLKIINRQWLTISFVRARHIFPTDNKNSRLTHRRVYL